MGVRQIRKTKLWLLARPRKRQTRFTVLKTALSKETPDWLRDAAPMSRFQMQNISTNDNHLAGLHATRWWWG